MSESRSELAMRLAELAACMDKRHLKFCRLVIGGSNKMTAYKEAGYQPKSPRTARSASSKLMRREDIAEYMGLLSQIMAVETASEVVDLKLEVLKELRQIGTSNIKRLYRDNGELIPVHELADADAAAVSSVKEKVVKTILNDAGQPVAEVIEREIKLWSKPQGLDSLAKILHLVEEYKPGDEQSVDVLDQVIADIQSRKDRGLPVVPDDA